MNSILSVAIPTRNRQEYAFAAAQAIVASGQDIEVCLSDNSDDQSLSGKLRDYISSGVVKYKYTKDRLSFAENFEAAIDLCGGRYISVIGDDDVIGPDIVPIAEWADRNGVDALTMRQHGRVLHYFWPGASTPRWKHRLGAALFLSDFSGRVRPVVREDALADALRHVGSGPRTLPRIYLGMVSRELIGRVRARWGRLFGSVSPDMFSGVLLALEAKRHVELDYPFLLPGACPQSHSIGHVVRPTESLQSQAHLKHFEEVSWDPRIPDFYSAETVWGQALVDVAGLAELDLPASGLADLYAACLLKAPGRIDAVRTAFDAYAATVGRPAAFAFLTAAVTRRAAGRLETIGKAALRRRPGGARFEYREIADTGAALTCLEDHLRRHGVAPRLVDPDGG